MRPLASPMTSLERLGENMPKETGPGTSSRLRTNGFLSDRTFHTLTTPSDEPV